MRCMSLLLALRDATDNSPTRRYWVYSGRAVIEPHRSILTPEPMLAMLVVLLPFALLATLVEWQRQIRIGASLLVIVFGIFRLVNTRHPRALARIPPTQLGLWSFAVAIAHGAGLMLVPIYLGLCRATDVDSGHEVAGALINGNLGTAVLVSLIHGATMIAAGGVLAWLVLPLPRSQVRGEELVQSSTSFR
jgi:hypothetical protein